MIDFEVAEHPAAQLGEGPVWDYRTGRFLWVDAFSHGFYSLDQARSAGGAPASPSNAGSRVSESSLRPRHHHTGAFTIGITLLGDSGSACVVTEADGFRVRSPDNMQQNQQDAMARTSCPYHLLPPPSGAEATSDSHRFNDVAAIPGGIFLAGVMPWSPDPSPRASGLGALIAFDSQLHPRLVCGEVRLPNGIGYDPAADVVYFTDSFRKTIYRIPTGVIREVVAGARSPISLDSLPPEIGVFADSSDRPGVPDGLTVTSEGSVFSARWGGSCIDRYDAEGVLVRSYPVPMRQPSSLCFGGEDFSTAIITSATENTPVDGQGPYDGATIFTDFGVRGLPEPALQWDGGVE